MTINVRSRIWIALAFLTVATVLVATIAWFSLDRVNSGLDELHAATIKEVTDVLQLSKQTSEIATTAPFLLSFPSAFLISSEGENLTLSIENTLENWRGGLRVGNEENAQLREAILTSLRNMGIATTDLTNVAVQLMTSKAKTAEMLSEISLLEQTLFERSLGFEQLESERENWLRLLSIIEALQRAARADNMLAVGEGRRTFQSRFASLQHQRLNDAQFELIEKARVIAKKPPTLFEQRRTELNRQLSAQNALFRIKTNAARIAALAEEFTRGAEQSLREARNSASTSIALAKYLILLSVVSSVAVAVLAAYYFSSYVMRSIHQISSAMTRLAKGDKDTTLDLTTGSNDEISHLFESFGVFRENANKLERRNKQLKQNSALIENVLSNISEGVAITDAQGRINAVSDSLRELISRPPSSKLIGEKLNKAVGTAGFQKTQSLPISANQSGISVAELSSENGRILEVRTEKLPGGGAVSLFADVSERRKLEQRIKTIKHIEGLGKVSGEVAHDFGNILSAISASVEVVKSADDKARSLSAVERISSSIDRGTMLVQRLLAFAKKQALSPEPVELNQLITGLKGLVEVGLKDGVELDFSPSAEKIWVNVDPGQLENAILNVCLNSNHAIQDEGNILITVSGGKKSNAIVSIRDNGIGMDEDTARRVFEPFFSRTDGGTGLGLATVYGFIRQSNGDVEVVSEPGVGTTIRISLPQFDAAKMLPSTSLKLEHALLVEDDSTSAEVAAKDLRSLGLETTIVSSASEALKKIDNQKFDLVITDVNLADGDRGWELYEHVKSSSPLTLTIVMSGKPQDSKNLDEDAKASFVAKPLTVEKLLGRVNQKLQD